jgi:hypothetical protein
MNIKSFTSSTECRDNIIIPSFYWINLLLLFIAYLATSYVHGLLQIALIKCCAIVLISKGGCLSYYYLTNPNFNLYNEFYIDFTIFKDEKSESFYDLIDTYFESYPVPYHFSKVVTAFYGCLVLFSIYYLQLNFIERVGPMTIIIFVSLGFGIGSMIDHFEYHGISNTPTLDGDTSIIDEHDDTISPEDNDDSNTLV